MSWRYHSQVHYASKMIWDKASVVIFIPLFGLTSMKSIMPCITDDLFWESTSQIDYQENVPVIWKGLSWILLSQWFLTCYKERTLHLATKASPWLMFHEHFMELGHSWGHKGASGGNGTNGQPWRYCGLNTLRLGIPYMHQWTGSSLVYVMACGLPLYAITWTNADLLSTGPLQMHFN